MLTHIPDVTTKKGLLDVIMVGNILEFSAALDRDYIGKKAPQDITEEWFAAMAKYRSFMNWYCSKFIIDFGREATNPCYIFHKSLIDFGWGLCSYVKRWENAVKSGVTSAQLEKTVLNHFRMDWQHLLGEFEHCLEQDDAQCRFFSWTGPDFRIYSRGNQVWEEVEDLSSAPVYRKIPVDDDDDERNSDEVHDIAERKEMGVVRRSRRLATGKKFERKLPFILTVTG